VFDVLMINGTSLAGKSLRRRKEVLSQNRIFKPIAGRFELADLWDGNSADDIDMRLKDIVGTKSVEARGTTDSSSYVRLIGAGFSMKEVKGW
jgi:hypothetical protein